MQDVAPRFGFASMDMFALHVMTESEAFRNPASFPSSWGRVMNDHMNQVLRGNTLCSDGDYHRRLAASL